MAGLFDAIFNDDPSTADSAGLTQADRSQVGFGSLMQLGATLLAAGQPMWGDERAKILAQLGNIPRNAQAMRQSIAAQKTGALKAQAAKTALDNQQKALAAMQSPEFQQQLGQLTPAQQAVAKAAAASGDVKSLTSILQLAKPQPAGDGTVLYGGYIIDPMLGTRTPIDAKGLPAGPTEAADHIGSMAGIPAADNSQLQPGQRNEAWLASVAQQNPALANMVKLYADGKMPAPSAYQMRNPRMLKILSMVSQYDPSFDAANYPARAAFLKNMAQGQYAQTVDAANKFLNHAASYLQSFDKLGLDNGFVGGVTNAAKREYMQLTHDPRLAEVRANLKPLLDEFAKFMGGKGQLTDAARHEYETALTDAQTPQEAKAVVEKMVELMQGQLKPIADRRAQVMGNPNSIPLDFIQPDARQALSYINGFDADKSGGGRSAPAAAQPAQGSAAGASPSRAELEAEMRKRGLLK